MGKPWVLGAIAMAFHASTEMSTSSQRRKFRTPLGRIQRFTKKNSCENMWKSRWIAAIEKPSDWFGGLCQLAGGNVQLQHASRGCPAAVHTLMSGTNSFPEKTSDSSKIHWRSHFLRLVKILKLETDSLLVDKIWHLCLERAFGYFG